MNNTIKSQSQEIKRQIREAGKQYARITASAALGGVLIGIVLGIIIAQTFIK